MKRVRATQRDRRNPLFEKWLKEWLEEANANGSNLRFTLKPALKRMRECPFVLRNGQQCCILDKFGKKLAAMIDKKLEQFKLENPGYNFETGGAIDAITDAGPSRNRAPTAGPSGVQQVPVAGPSRVQQAPVAGPSNPPKKRRVNNKNKANNDEDNISDNEDTPTINKPVKNIYFPPNTAEIWLVVDTGETSKGSLKHASKIAARKELEANNVPHLFRKLSVGDFWWIAKQGDEELVLPYIIERKRTDDFNKSILDKRYKEQKMRLRSTGLNVIYLIEVLARDRYAAMKEERLLQAEVNTEINDKFTIHRTNSVKETVAYLNALTKIITKKFKVKTLRNCVEDMLPVFKLNERELFLYTFEEMSNNFEKLENFTVREMFAQQLLQISGTSVDSIIAIVEKYSTPFILRQAFAECSNEKEGIQLISSLTFGAFKRNISEEIARKIWLLYTSPVSF